MSINEDSTDKYVKEAYAPSIDFLRNLARNNWDSREYYRKLYSKYYWKYEYLTENIIPYLILILLKEKNKMLKYNGNTFDLNDIKDKESYLELVKIWKDTYKELSNDIRELKRTRKTFIWNRTHSKIEKSKIKIGNNPAYDPMANSRVQILSYYATLLLDFRANMKQIAKKQSKQDLAT